jgi:hypothetical protein
MYDYNQVLGPLQHIIDLDRKKRDALKNKPTVPPLKDLRLLGTVNEDELGQVRT